MQLQTQACSPVSQRGDNQASTVAKVLISIFYLGIHHAHRDCQVVRVAMHVLQINQQGCAG